MFEGLRFANWKAEAQVDGIVVLTIDRADASVNAFDRATLEELEQIVERLAIEPPKGVVIRSGKAKGFVAGADIHEFETYEKNGIGAGQHPVRPARVPEPVAAALPDGRRDPRLLHGRRHRNGARLPLSHGYARSDRRRSACPK